MQFTGIANPFGTEAFEPVVNTSPRTTTYYRGMRLEGRPTARKIPAPKPLSHYLKTLLLADI
jgi:hypothetical protein